LAVAAVVGDDGIPLALDIVPDAAGEGDLPGDVVRAAEVDRVILAIAERRQSVVTLGTDGDTAGEALERIANTNDGAFLGADDGIARIRFSRNMINGMLIEDSYIYRLT